MKFKAFLLAFVVLLASGCSTNSVSNKTATTTPIETVVTTTTVKNVTTTTRKKTTTKKITTKPAPTMGEKNALDTAYSYLRYMAFSYSGLIEQLEYEGYLHSEAVYAVDNCGADWNQQAAKCAKSYLDYMSFSRQGLIEQLEYEGFTHSQAVYGVEANGY